MYQTNQYEGMIAETVAMQGHKGETINAYVARPLGSGPFPGMVVIHHAPGWDEWFSGEKNQYNQFNYTANDNGQIKAFGNAPEDYEQDVFRGKAVDFIQRMAQDTQPFSQQEIDVWPGYIGRTSLQLLSASLPFRTIKPADFGAHLLGTVYFTSESTLQRHPDALRRFLGVLIDLDPIIVAEVAARIGSSLDEEEPRTPLRAFFSGDADDGMVEAAVRLAVVLCSPLT